MSAYSKSGSSDSAAKIRLNTPLSAHRRKRFHTEEHLPKASGRSRHGDPARTIHNTASMNRRLSSPDRPGSPSLPGSAPSQFDISRSALGERDRRDEPAVVGLLAMGRAAVAEEAVLVGVGVESEILEPADARAGGAFGYIGLEIEHRLARLAAGDEKAPRLFVGLGESCDEFGADFIR